MLHYLFLTVTSLLYAGNFVAGKTLVNYTSPLTVNDLRWALAVPLLIAIVWWRERKLLPPLTAVPYLIALGLTGVALFNIFTYMALTQTSPDDVGLISALNPITIAVASLVFLKERITALQMMGMVLSFVGVVIVISQGRWVRVAHFAFNAGDVWMLAAIVTWGLFAVAGRKAMETVSPYMSTLWGAVFGVLMMLPFDLPTFYLTRTDSTFWTLLLYSVLGGTIIATILWNIGIKQVGPIRAGIFLNFNPIFTAILAYFSLGIVVTVSQIIGTLLVMAGVTWFTLSGRKKVRI